MMLGWLLSLALVGCRNASPAADTRPTLAPPLQPPAGATSYPGEANPATVPDSYHLVGQSDTLALYLDEETSGLIVVDRRNGTLWRSIPADLADNDTLNNSWRRRITSPVLLSYVGPERRQVKVADLSKKGVEVSYAPLANGVQAQYTFSNEGLGFAVNYTVEGDALVVTLPGDRITEEGKNGLVSIRLLSFFGATHDGEDGYLFFPDGSGSLIRYTTQHPEESQEISRVIYGEDSPQENASGFRESVAMPVFGLSHGDAAYIGVITRGDFDAKINVARSGKRVNYNRIGAEFLYRRQGLFSLGGGKPVLVYEPDRIGGDRQIRYFFLPQEQADYVGMAQRYRQYLLDSGFQRVTAPMPLMHVTLFTGVERKTWFLRDLIQMTTFDEGAAMLDDLAAHEVAPLVVTVRGWAKGGETAAIPLRRNGSLPVERQLGGKSGLKRLLETAQQHGQTVLLFDKYLPITPGGHNVLPSRDAVRGDNGLPYGNSQSGYDLNPQVALRRFAPVNFARMAKIGVAGVTLDRFAEVAYPDSNEKYPLSRENFAATWMQIASLARQDLGTVAMTGGNVYAAPYADLLINVPLDSTHYDMSDEPVPFYEIALHGLVAYTGAPFDLLSDDRRMLLREVECGAVPNFILTEDTTSKLYRTPANWIWSARYADWRDEVLAQAQTFRPLAQLGGQFIVGHRQIADGVTETTYEGGARVIVNYTAQPYTVGQTIVPAEDFVVLP